MPIWVFSHSVGAFTAYEKRDLAEAVTKLYTEYDIPAFYVSVQFIALGAEDLWYGGVPHPKFTLVTIYHVAANVIKEPIETQKKFIEEVDDVLTPRMTKKGMGWEYLVFEGAR